MKKIYDIGEVGMSVAIVQAMVDAGIKLPHKVMEQARKKFNNMTWNYNTWKNELTFNENS